MSRDVFYMVPSENDGRNDQQAAAAAVAAAATSESINNRQRDESNESIAVDTDYNHNIEDRGGSGSSGEERVRPFIKERIYYAAKDGLPLALTSLLSSVESETTKNSYINQVNLKNNHESSLCACAERFLSLFFRFYICLFV